MLLLRFDATEKRVDNRPGPQQVSDAGEVPRAAGSTLLRAGRPGVGPADLHQPPTTIRKQQQELVPALSVHPPQDGEASAPEGMRVTDDGDEVGKVFGMGSVSGVPSVKSRTLTCYGASPGA